MSTKLRIMKGNPFTTIQGEGFLVGMPSVFLRTAGCDLRCKRDMPGYLGAESFGFFTCDTPDSLPDYDHKLRVFQDLPTRHAETFDTEQMANILEQKMWECSGLPLEDLVITGGEPVLQADALVDMLAHRHALSHGRDIRVTLETNCRSFHTVLASFVTLPSLSPKLQQITAQAKDRGWALADVRWEELVEGQTMLQWFSRIAQNDDNRIVQVKVVCSTVDEYLWARELFRWARPFTNLLPIVSVADSPHTNLKGLIDAVIRDGHTRLMLQAHKSLGVP